MSKERPILAVVDDDPDNISIIRIIMARFLPNWLVIGFTSPTFLLSYKKLGFNLPLSNGELILDAILLDYFFGPQHPVGPQFVPHLREKFEKAKIIGCSAEEANYPALEESGVDITIVKNNPQAFIEGLINFLKNIN
ncbi:MAG: hypothetical protein PVJ09_04835 [Candidatus Woesebacteria bacterium]|jgi:hypothetical protein